MSLAQYDLTGSADHLSFEFYSDGPQGTIKKVIQYTKLSDPWDEAYNLGFGDSLETTGKINDLSVTNNQDRDKVLRTVASSVLHFFDRYPNAQILFQGSTPARTRLYIGQISKHWSEVENHVVVEGLTSQNWESFQRNGRYKALSITKKKS